MGRGGGGLARAGQRRVRVGKRIRTDGAEVGHADPKKPLQSAVPNAAAPARELDELLDTAERVGDRAHGIRRTTLASLHGSLRRSGCCFATHTAPSRNQRALSYQLR